MFDSAHTEALAIEGEPGHGLTDDREIRLAGGKVVLQGIPDLVLRSPRQDERARDLIVDLKTGLPRPEQDRHELRFYALLATLDRGRPPFRWATFYVTEGRPEIEDLKVETLQATVRRVVDGIKQAVRLAISDGDAHRLRAGDWCRFCARQPHCPEAAAHAGRGGLSQPPGMLGT